MNQEFKKEFIKLAVTKSTEDVWKGFVGGAVGGTAAGLILSPLDVINTVMQAGGPGAHKSSWQTAKNIYKMEGAKGFYRGLNVKLPKVIAAGAITFGTAIAIKNMLDKNQSL